MIKILALFWNIDFAFFTFSTDFWKVGVTQMSGAFFRTHGGSFYRFQLLFAEYQPTNSVLLQFIRSLPLLSPNIELISLHSIRFHC